MAVRISIGVSASAARAARLLPPATRAAQPSGQQNFNNSLRHYSSSASSFLRKGGASFSSPSSRRALASTGVFAWGRGFMQQATTELAPKTAPAGQDIATFAGGCFWGLELAFQREPGVTHTSVGYTQGNVEAPSYQAVCSGRTGHAEAVQVYFNPKEVTYERLLELFFDRTDPTTKNRQGNDMGTQYRSGIYYHSDEQKSAAEKAIAEINDKLKQGTWRPVSGKDVVVELAPAGDYWLAEDYHQQYLEKGGQDASKGATSRIRCYG